MHYVPKVFIFVKTMLDDELLNEYENNIMNTDNSQLSKIEEKQKKSFKDIIAENTFINYLTSHLNRYKWIIFFVVIVIVIAYIEVVIATSMSDCSYFLNKNKILKIKPSCVKIDDDDYIYVYNENVFTRREVENKAKVPDYYEKLVVTDHISKQISKPISEIKYNFHKGIHSPTPVNDITNNLINVSKLKDLVNPINSFNSYASSWCVLYPDYAKINCFCTKDKLFFN